MILNKFRNTKLRLVPSFRFVIVGEYIFEGIHYIIKRAHEIRASV